MGLHKSEIFFYFLASFLGGVFAASVFDITYSFGLVLVLVLIILLAITFHSQKQLKRGIAIIVVIFSSLFFAGGMFRFITFADSGNQIGQYLNLTKDGDSADIVLRGYVHNEPVLSGSNLKFNVMVKELRVEDGAIDVSDKILVTTQRFPGYEIGEKVELAGKIKVPENFDEFDYKTYLKKEGVDLVMGFPDILVIKDLGLSKTEIAGIKFYRLIFSLKNKFESSIVLSVPEPGASFINGILLGSRQNIPEDLREAFNKTGTTHILAISGYNIMIISWAVLSGLVWFFRRRAAFWISVGIIIAFVILTGASASVVRAAVMGLMLSFAHGYGRLYDQKNSIILAGAAMVWFNPMVLVFDVGFQLSFAAVSGLIYLYPRLEAKILPKVHNSFKELVFMTISAQISVSPLLIYYFGNFSLLSLPANILILPFVPASMLLGFLSGLGGMLYLPLGQVMGYLAWAITTYQITVIEFFASMI